MDFSFFCKEIRIGLILALIQNMFSVLNYLEPKILITLLAVCCQNGFQINGSATGYSVYRGMFFLIQHGIISLIFKYLGCFLPYANFIL